MDDLEIPKLNKLSLHSMNKISKLVPVLATITIISLAISGFLFYKYQIEGTKYDPLHHIKNDISQNLPQEEINRIVAEVGKLIKLPTNEQPTLGTVIDVTKLKDQPFFQKSKNGDKMLIYPNAHKIILYDPVAKQIIDVAPINIGSSSAQQAPIQAKISLRNGTGAQGLASKIESIIKKSYPDADIVNRDNASRDSYDKTLVVALKDSAKEAATTLAKTLNATVDNLPLGETNLAGLDIIVIIGKDKL